MECNFVDPVNLGTEAKADWEYSALNCNDTKEVLIKDPTDPNIKFALLKQYSYGDITSIVLQGLILFFLIFLLFKKLFFQDRVKIHSIGSRKF